MKNTHKENKDFTIEHLTLSEIQSYLKLPNGLSYIELTRQAITISNEHNIPLEDALLYTLWGNGYPSVLSPHDAIAELIQFNFGRNINEFGVLLLNGKLNGYCYLDDKENWTLISCPKYDKKQIISMLARNLSARTKFKNKEINFLKAVKNCINAIGHDFYDLPKEKSLDDVTNVLEIDIDIAKLLSNGHGTNSTLRYALASCYNDIATAKYLMNKTLLNKHQYDGLKTLKISDESARNSVYEYMNKYHSFGAMCINLDDKNKKIITDLIDNYCGW